MTRQSRTAIVLGVALVAAAVASYGVYEAVTKMPVRQVEMATVKTVVAAKALPLGARITTDSVKIVNWPAKAPLQNGFTDVNVVVDRGLIAPVAENEPILENKLAPREAGVGLPPSIPEGMRAMSVKVDEVVGVAGFVVPGTHVDVLAIVHPSRNYEDRVVTTVVKNVQVLTAGTRIDQEKAAKDSKPIPSTVVTLLVSPDDAQKVALAQKDGDIMLALRNPLDTGVSDVESIGTTGLLAGSVDTKAPAPKAAPAPRRSNPKPAAPVALTPPPEAPQYTVIAIRGAKRTEEVVK